MRHTFRAGERVAVSDCGGLESRAAGTVMRREFVPVSGRGIPLLPGEYRPMTRDDVAILTDGGRIIIMPRQCVGRIQT